MNLVKQPNVELVAEDEVFKVARIYDEYFDNYLISNYGRLYSLNRNMILNKRICSHGYIRYKLSKEGKYKYVTAHRLVAYSFVENINPDKYNTVLHKDDNPTNSKWTNLMWGTDKMNMNWNDLQKRKAAKRGNTVLQFDLDNNLIAEYETLREASRQTNLPAASICYGVHNNRVYKGCYWKYKESA